MTMDSLLYGGRALIVFVLTLVALIFVAAWPRTRGKWFLFTFLALELFDTFGWYALVLLQRQQILTWGSFIVQAAGIGLSLLGIVAAVMLLLFAILRPEPAQRTYAPTGPVPGYVPGGPPPQAGGFTPLR